MAVTMKDIAKMAGVSRQAVQTVLNGSLTSKVAEETRLRILELVASTGYRCNLSARILNGKTTRTVAVFVAFNQLLIYDEFQKSLVRHLAVNGYRALLFPLVDPHAERTILNDAPQFGLDGVIAVDCMSSIKHDEINLPLLTVMLPEEAKSEVMVNSEEGFFLLAQHLIKEHGHKKLALIGLYGITDSPKHRGLVRAAAAAALPTPSVVTLSWNEHYATQILKLIREDGVTAFMASNDLLAVRLISFLSRHGIKVPGEVAVTGFDGDFYANSGVCRITTMVQPMRQLAACSAKLLLEKIRTQNCAPLQKEARVSLLPSILIGDSCGCHPVPDRTICWENLPLTFDGVNDSIVPPPESMREVYQTVRQANVGDEDAAVTPKTIQQ